jgi:hypothetical protein
MYASPASLLCLPPPKRRVTWGKFAPAGWGRPEEAVWQISAALIGRVIRGELRPRASDAGEGIPPHGEMSEFYTIS